MSFPFLIFSLLSLFVSWFNPLFSQIENDKWSGTIELCLPSGRANAAFKDYLNGLVNVYPKIQYKVLPNWFVAAGPRYQYSTISEFKVPEKMNGGMHVVGGNIELGWSKWQTPRFALEVGLRAGVAQHIFITDSTRTSQIQRVNAGYLEPTLTFVLAADEAVAYRWIVGYNITGFGFKPWNIGVNTNGGFQLSDFNKATQSILIGFGMTYYFGNTRSDVFIDEE